MTEQKSIVARLERPFTPSLELRRVLLKAIFLLTDVLCIAMSYLLMGWIYLGPVISNYALSQALLILPVFIVIGIYNETYSLRALRDLRFSLSRIATTVLVSSALLISMVYFLKESTEISRVFLVFGMVIGLAAMIALRIVLLGVLGRHFAVGLTNVLIIHDNGPKVEMAHAFHLDAAALGLRADLDNPNALHNLGHYVDNMDRVIVSCDVASRSHWSFLLRAAGVDGEVVSESLAELSPIGLKREAGFVSLVISTKPLGFQQRLVKRLMDLTISGIAFLAFSPIFLLAAIAIKIEDGGPVFFVQRRMGKGNKFFRMLKFRSMAVVHSDFGGSRSAKKSDPRITRVGGFLRRTSLDELPQLLNILKGDMSLVGPRPHALGSLAGEKLFWEVDRAYWSRHSLKPGLTGLAQVRGLRGATDLETDLSQRLRADLEYIANWSPFNDLLIMLLTFKVMIHDRAF